MPTSLRTRASRVCPLKTFTYGVISASFGNAEFGRKTPRKTLGSCTAGTDLEADTRRRQTDMCMRSKQYTIVFLRPVHDSWGYFYGIGMLNQERGEGCQKGR